MAAIASRERQHRPRVGAVAGATFYSQQPPRRAAALQPPAADVCRPLAVLTAAEGRPPKAFGGQAFDEFFPDAGPGAANIPSGGSSGGSGSSSSGSSSSGSGSGGNSSSHGPAAAEAPPPKVRPFGGISFDDFFGASVFPEAGAPPDPAAQAAAEAAVEVHMRSGSCALEALCGRARCTWNALLSAPWITICNRASTQAYPIGCRCFAQCVWRYRHHFSGA